MASGAMDERVPVEFELNGRPVSVWARPKRSALDLLREELGLYALKPGCSPQGICGSCLVRVDGKVRLTCTLPGRSLAGKRVSTLDHEPAAEQVARAFCASGAVGCGYCVPGVLTQVCALLERAPDPTPDDLQKALNMHTCRCTGWWRMEDAVRLAARARASGEALPPGGDAERLALGEQAFVDDVNVPGLWHAAVVWAPSARGVLRGLDTSAVGPEARVLTAADLAGVPGAAGVLVAVGGDFTGDRALALVLARTRDAACQARARVQVQAEALPVVSGLAEAAADPARVAVLRRVREGDLNRALDDRSLVLVKESFTAAGRATAAIEPDAAVALPVAGGLRVLSNADRPCALAARLAEALGLTQGAVRVEQVPAGGGFGGRGASPVALWAGVAAQVLGAPVKLSPDLEECARLHRVAPALSARLMLGARPDGGLVGLKAMVQLDLGADPAGAEEVVEALAAHLCGAWRVPHVEVELRGVRTDNPGAGAVRGALAGWFFALEGCMDRLAARLGRDPLELRVQNALTEAEAEDPGVLAALRAVEPAWRAAAEAGVPAGVAVALVRFGGRESEAAIEVAPGPALRLVTPVPEEGQGAWAVLAARVAGRLGLPAGTVEVGCDSRVQGDPELAWTGKAALAAADALAAEWDRGVGLEGLVGRRFEGRVGAGAPGLAACAVLVTLRPDGSLGGLVVAQDLGDAREEALAGAQTDGALLFGLGAALTEALSLNQGLADPRLRNMGVLKAAQMPPRERVVLATPSRVGPDGLRAWGEVAALPVAAAVAAALARVEGAPRTALPMVDSPAAPRKPGARPA